MLKLQEIKKLLDAVELTTNVDLNLEVKTIRASDLMSDVLTADNPGEVLLTGLVNAQSIRTADVVDLKVVIFVRNKLPDEAAINMAQNRDIHLLATTLPMFKACGILYSQMGG